jgi:hypothetical protein
MEVKDEEGATKTDAGQTKKSGLIIEVAVATVASFRFESGAGQLWMELAAEQAFAEGFRYAGACAPLRLRAPQSLLAKRQFEFDHHAQPCDSHYPRRRELQQPEIHLRDLPGFTGPILQPECKRRSNCAPQNGSAYGNRTRLSALRGPCPN